MFLTCITALGNRGESCHYPILESMEGNREESCHYPLLQLMEVSGRETSILGAELELKAHPLHSIPRMLSAT